MQSVDRQTRVLPLLVVAFAFAVLALPLTAKAQPAAPVPSTDRCGESTRHTSQADALAASTGIPKTQFSCQRVTADVARSRCFSGACTGPADVQCCVPGAGSAPEAPAPAAATTSGTTPAASSGSSGGGAIAWPPCIDDGNCSLDDIIKAGAAFANFLFGISGAVFLAIFVYAGVLYLVAGGDTGRVKQSKDMLKNAVIGIVLVFGAYALVTTVYTAFIGTGGEGAATGAGTPQCAVRFPNHVCMFVEDLSGGTSAARASDARERGCKTDAGLCPGPANYLCCPVDPGSSDAVSEDEDAAARP